MWCGLKVACGCWWGFATGDTTTLWKVHPSSVGQWPPLSSRIARYKPFLIVTRPLWGAITMDLIIHATQTTSLVICGRNSATAWFFCGKVIPRAWSRGFFCKLLRHKESILGKRHERGQIPAENSVWPPGCDGDMFNTTFWWSECWKGPILSQSVLWSHGYRSRCSVGSNQGAQPLTVDPKTVFRA